MARITWDESKDRRIEYGVDRGVLYPIGGTAVAWNGLRSVKEEGSVKTTPVYFDGVKFADVAELSGFEGEIEALTYPDEFLEIEGTAAADNGVYLTEQQPRRFHMSYRTQIQDGLSEKDYKIHILYNVLAAPQDVRRVSMGVDDDPIEFSWKISAIPEEVPGFRPTAHLILDSRWFTPELLEDIEFILYGDSINDPYLPDMATMVGFIQRWARFIVVDNGDGTWTAQSLVPGQIQFEANQGFTIHDAPGEFVDSETYNIRSSERLVVTP